GKCHRKCNRYRKAYPQKTSVVYGIHDYTDADLDAEQPYFQYFACVAVEQVLKQKLKHIILPEGTYLVFSFFADPKTSMEPFAQDIYQNWLPKSA
ncbi:GyrI-like domain-containing protein, partial [Desulfovibrio desulfuricans]|nr:GyrI-like domain-containing protein [Desulfovibrio desulfuricans]